MTAFILTLALSWPGFAPAQDVAEQQSANAGAKAFCDPAIVAFDADLGQVTPGLDAFEKLLAAAKAGQDKAEAGKIEPGKTGSNPAGAGQADQAGAQSTIAQAQMIKETVGHQIEAAKAYRAQAAEALARAAAEPRPAVAAVHYKDALVKIEAARGYLGKAATTLSLPKQPAEAVAHRIDLRDDGEALRQLRSLADDAKKPGDQLGLLMRDWDAGAARAMAVATPPVDRSFGIVRYDDAAKTLTMSNKQTIDVRPLDRALAATGPRGPLFQPIPSPGGNPVPQPSPDLMRTLADPALRQAVQAVGGVALDITFELLSRAGMPNMSAAHALAYVERPVMLSLATLYERVKTNTRTEGDWRALPDDLRYPGNLGRIHGYVLDPARKDVLLVGAPAGHPGDRIDIDTISILLATAWRAGQVPAVSLDPVPSDPAGPQYPRILNVPADSIVAKTMLDADYEMKSLTLGLRPVAGSGFKSSKDLIKTKADAGFRAARYWFYPVPLRDRTVQISQSGRSVLFASGVQVLTESMTIENGALVPTGEVGRIERQVADSLTATFAALAARDDIQPPGIFRRLHGLVDMTTVAVFLRRAGVDYAVLDSISRLPHRRLTDAEAVPAWYPGLTSLFPLRDAPTGYAIAGGVEMRARALRDGIEVRDDPSLRALEKTAQSVRSGRDLVVAAPLPIALAVAASDGDRERRMLAGTRALASDDNARARQAFAEATRLDPLNSEAWARLAHALANLDRMADAQAAIARAMAIDPGDMQIRAAALDVALRANPDADPMIYGRETMRALSQEYVTRAFGAIAAGQQERAMALAERALELTDDNPDGYLAQAWARGGAQPEAERRDIVEAVRYARRQSRYAGDGAMTQKLSFLLSVSAVQRFQRAGRLGSKIKVRAPDRDVAFLIDEMQRATDEAQDSRKLDPTQPLAIAAEVQARALRVAFLQAAGQTATTAPAHRLLEDGLRHFANFPALHTARAVLATVDGQLADAVAALDDALRLAPAAGELYILRATAEAELGQCAEARADLARAKNLGVTIDAAELDALGACG